MFTQILNPTGNLFVTWLVALVPVLLLLFLLAVSAGGAVDEAGDVDEQQGVRRMGPVQVHDDAEEEVSEGAAELGKD